MVERVTGETEGHTHTYEDSVDGGMTSMNDGHVHRYVIDEGEVIIFMEDGHTHTAGETAQREEYEEKRMTCQLEIKQIDEEDKFFTFEGYASTFGNTDRGSDVVLRGAFLDSIREMESRAVQIPGTNMRKIMPILWQHQMDEPIGSFVQVQEDAKGLFVRGILPKEDTLVAGRVMPQMRAGAVSDMSIGFMINESEMEGRVRKLQKVTLFETSLVTIPMNPEATVTGFKAVVPFQDLPLASRDREWDSDAAIARVRQFVNANDAPNEAYRRAFLFYKREEPENFGSYKLPIADVIDGRLMAVPRAVFAAAGALRGARGGVDVPEGDRAGLRANVERYYRKMGLDSPFTEQSGFRIDDISAYDERELEKLLKSGVQLPGETAKTVVSILKGLKCDADEPTEEVKRDVDLTEVRMKLKQLEQALKR